MRKRGFESHPVLFGRHFLFFESLEFGQSCPVIGWREETAFLMS